MKELGFVSSPRPFNEIMHLYAKSLKIEKVLGVLADLKKTEVLPDNDSYRICISSFGLKHDMDGMERMLREMESQPHIVMDWCTYAVVAEFYEREFLVDKATDALEKARMALQKKRKKNRGNYNLMSSDYENVVKSLVKLGELAEAKKYAKEWEALGNWRSVDDICIPYTIIEEYIRNGALLKAYYIIWDWTIKGKMGVYNLSRILCNECIKVGDLLQAFKCFLVEHWNSVNVNRLFIQYLEEECGSFFPLRCAGSLCTRSLKTAAGKTLLELIPLNEKFKFKVALLEHPEDSGAQAVKNLDYENIIKSLVESGELSEARKMAMEWGATGNLTSLDELNISKLIIDGYCKQSLFMEAEAMAVDWTRDNKCWVRGIWLILACHYQEHGKMVRGLECMRRFFSLTPSLKGNDHLMLQMFMFMVEYSRGIKAAGCFGNRWLDFIDLDRLLCPKEFWYRCKSYPSN
ncbi:hypothetical protein DM860_009296 [Cuscuta australis]|uniref:Pentacotripeptide-repeat region of PRORP domain-containing protein n=1 Tax=Cuscuta australis TaxID=267555 RepID=A0A328DF30_9ASTE|nr:hypothetical protein DM860_009296 [Cuscuta australis]